MGDPIKEVQEIRDKFTEYLIPDNVDERTKQIEEVLNIFDRIKEETDLFQPSGFKGKLEAIFKDYDDINKKGKVPEKEEYDKLYDMYNRSALMDVEKVPAQVEYGKKAEYQFPIENREKDDYVKNVQRLWTFLKVFANVVARDKEITYTEQVKQEFDKVFDSAYAEYKNSVKKNAPAEKKEEKKEEEKKPNENKDEKKEKAKVEQIQKEEKRPKVIIEQTVETYKKAKDKFLTEVTDALASADADDKSKFPEWDKTLKTNLNTLQRLEYINEIIDFSVKKLSELGKKKEELKTLQESLGKLADRKAIDDVEEDKKKLDDKKAELEKAINRWGYIQNLAFKLNHELSDEVNELKDALISFKAVAEEELRVISGHADAFNSVLDAVNAYSNVSSKNECECARDLYKACREYLNAHTGGDGSAQDEIGGQGTQTGRVRKAAVVKILEIMEFRASRNGGYNEFDAAKSSYETFYMDKYKKWETPELDFLALKGSLARRSKANIAPLQIEKPTFIQKAEFIDKKAYAELEKVTAGYTKKQTAQQKKLAEEQRKQRQSAPKAKA